MAPSWKRVYLRIIQWIFYALKLIDPNNVLRLKAFSHYSEESLLSSSASYFTCSVSNLSKLQFGFSMSFH